MENQIFNVCFLSPNNTIKQILVFGKNMEASTYENNFSIPVSNKPVVETFFTGERIHFDDTISLLKKKIIREYAKHIDDNIIYEEIYMFVDVQRSEKWEKVYMNLAEKSDGNAPSIELLEQLKKNAPSLDISPDVATYEDFLNLSDTQTFHIPLGVRYSDSKSNINEWDPLFTVNPMSADSIRPKNMYIFENELLLNYIDTIANNQSINIYVCLASDYFAHPDAKSEYIPIYYTLLEKRGIRSSDDFFRLRHTMRLNLAAGISDKDYIDMFYDVAAFDNETIPDYVETGIRSFHIKIRPNIHANFVLPLETVFKIINASPIVPFIKFNPGLHRENLYRLYTNKVAKNGKKIPILPRSEINNITRKIGKSRQIAIYINGAQELYCTFDINGDIIIQSDVFDRALSLAEANELIKTYIQPIIDNVNEYLNSSGYYIPKFGSLRQDNIEIISIDYIWTIPDKSRVGLFNKQIEKFKMAFFSLFERIEFLDDIKRGINLKYKRVGNYKPMEAEKMLIADLFKKYGNVVQVLDDLINVYDKTVDEARLIIARYKDSTNIIIDNTGKTVVVENPGFLTNIRLVQPALNSKNINMVFEMSGITSFKYIDVLQIYVNAFFKLFLYPKSIPENIYKSFERKWLSVSAAAATKAAPAPAREKEMIITAPVAAAAAAAAAATEEELELPEEDISPVYSDEIDDELIDLLGDSDEDEEESSPPAAAANVQLPPPPEIDDELIDILGDSDDEEEEEENAEDKTLPPPATAEVQPNSDESDDLDLDLIDMDSESSESSRQPSSGGGDGAPLDIDQIEKRKKMLDNSSLHNLFSKRREELDKVLFRVPSDENNKTFKAYSRACPSNVYRQPIILTDEEKKNIDDNYPGSYTTAIKYGSDREHMNWYICPRYWCLLTNTSMTEADIMAGKCGNSTKIIPKNEKVIPKDTYIYQFNDYGIEHLDKHGNYIPHHPALTKAINEAYMKYPCCFKKWDENVQAEIRQILGDDGAAAAEATEPSVTTAAPPPTKPSATAPIPAATAIGYVIGPEKVPVPEGKWGFLPIVVQFFLQANNSLCARENNPNTLKLNTPCMLRYGVESATFLACIAEIYSYKNKLENTPSVDEFRRILIEKINIDQFMSANGGELIRIFSRDGAATASAIPSNINAEILSRYKEIEKIVRSALENFVEYIATAEKYEIDYKYLWDIICSPNFLFEDGLNLVILEIPNSDITGNVEIICPLTTYSSVPLYDSHKETAILIKTGKLYEPIFLYENRKDVLIIKKTYHPSTSTPTLKKVLETISMSTNRYCSPIKTIDFVRPIPISEIIRILSRGGAAAGEWKIERKIINYYGNIIGLYISREDVGGVIPCSPFQNHRAILTNIPSIFMDSESEKVGWKDYETTLLFLRNLARETGLPVHPVTKIIEDGLITGVLTETNQFISLDAPAQNNLGKDDGLPSIETSNLIITERDYLNSSEQDQERIKTTKMISLETQFYSAFRSQARALLNSYEYLSSRKSISKILAEKIPYRKKLKNIELELREIMEGHIEFIDFTENVLLSIEKISSCETNCDKKKYCMVSINGDCKLLLPREHLLHKSPNQIIYFARLADEIIRYKRIQTFLFNQNTFLNLSNIKYKILPDEIILLENNIKTGDYFESLVPEKYNITYSRAHPTGVEIPETTFTLEDQKKLAAAPTMAAAAAAAAEEVTTAAPAELNIQENIRPCIKEVLNHVKGNVNSKWYILLPNNCREIFFHTNLCSFAPIIYILQSIFERQITVNAIKEKLAEIYSNHINNPIHKDAIYKIFKLEGKRDISAKLEAGQIDIEHAIMSEDYYITNIDLWVFFSGIELPASIILFSAFKLKQIHQIVGDEIDWLLLNKSRQMKTAREKFIFIRSPTDFKTGIIPSYSVVTPAVTFAQLRIEFQQEFREAVEQNMNNVLQFSTYLESVAKKQFKRRHVILE